MKNKNLTHEELNLLLADDEYWNSIISQYHTTRPNGLLDGYWVRSGINAAAEGINTTPGSRDNPIIQPQPKEYINPTQYTDPSTGEIKQLQSALKTRGHKVLVKGDIIVNGSAYTKDEKGKTRNKSTMKASTDDIFMRKYGDTKIAFVVLNGENKRSVFESPVSYSFLRELQDGVTTRGFLLSRPDVDKQLKEKKLRICSTPIDDTFKFIELERKRSKPTPEKKVTFTG